MTFTIFAFALAAGTPTAVGQTPVQMMGEPELAAASLSQGKNGEAIRVLEAELSASPDDPALLINLGIAHAHRGNDAKARALFKAAMTSEQAIDLETADGTMTDSRRLARKALAMLERGELGMVARPAEQLTLRN